MRDTKGSPEEQLGAFIDKYSPEIAKMARKVRAKLRSRYPTAHEIVYDNYNALDERTSSVIFSIALYPRWISLFFLKAKGLTDPEKKLKGDGKIVKHIRLESPETLDEPAVRDLLAQAVAKADVPFEKKGKHRLIIKSISAKQRPRRPE
jgi:hypothetical protein